MENCAPDQSPATALSCLSDEGITRTAKSGGDLRASQNTAERDPAVMQDWAPPEPRKKYCRPTDWPDDHTDMLRQWMANGYSASLTAQAINDRFGTTYTRNSVIGRAHRLNIKSANNNGKPAQSNAEYNAKRRERRARYRLADATGDGFRPGKGNWRLPKLACISIDPLNISFDEMASDQTRCKWPGDEYPYTYCGHPRHGDRPYCLGHHLLGTETPRKRYA